MAQTLFEIFSILIKIFQSEKLQTLNYSWCMAHCLSQTRLAKKILKFRNGNKISELSLSFIIFRLTYSFNSQMEIK